MTQFLDADIAPFLSMAKGEGWICGRWELEFLLKSFAKGCLVKREGRSARGYVTSIRYERSGWIGNLLVPPEFRRRGIGRELMECAVSALLGSGAETIWLTASEQGLGLYRRLGFLPVGEILRWTGKGGGGRGATLLGEPDLKRAGAVDREGWGERRDSLLRVTCNRGRFFSSPGGFICCQRWEEGIQIGPWGCLADDEAGPLLDRALPGVKGRVFLDVPAANRAATALLAKRGFSVRGRSTLMYLGAEPLYRPGKVFALASMGSIG